MFLMVMLLAASCSLFAAGEAGAVTFDYTLGAVTVSQTDTSATYTYPLCQVPGSGTLSYIDFEIPGNLSIPVGAFSSAGTANFEVRSNGVGLSGEVYGLGVGDFGTKFAVGDTRYRLLKANVPNPPACVTIELTIKGQTLAPGQMFSTDAQGAVLIKAGNGANTMTFVTLTPAIADMPLEAPPIFSSVSVFPNPITPPACATISWQLSSAATVTIAPTDFVTEFTDSSATICPVATGTYTYQITAQGQGPTGTSSTVSIVVSANPPVVIETTCKQIRKNGGTGQSCIYLCLSTTNGGLQSIESATWYNTPDCTGNGVELNIYGEDSPEKTLVCAPCTYTDDPNDPNPQACTMNADPSQTPFRYEQLGASGNPWKNCDVFMYERQDQGFAAVLGTDPWVVINGRQVWTR